jgi:protein-tyrosine phosphatase
MTRAPEPVTGTSTDLHNHLMPGVDDGAANDDEARSALLAMRDAGVRRIATTPHVSASAFLRRSWEKQLTALDAAWQRLRELGAEVVPDVELHRGAEVRLDIPDPDLSDPRIRLGGGPSVLVEFAYFTVPPHSERLVARLREGGWIPVIAHPERYRGIATTLGVVATWRAAGGLVQVNAGSFTGRYGNEPKSIAQTLLAHGLIDCIASDYHGRGAPALSGARAWITSIGPSDQADLLFEINPARILKGEAPLPVPPLERKRGPLSRFWSRFIGG